MLHHRGERHQRHVPVSPDPPGRELELARPRCRRGDDPPKSSAQLTITAKSIQTRNQQRDEALRSKYLDTGNHPAITFTSTKVEQAGDTNFAVTGDLTIRGVTKPVTVDFKLTGAKTDPWGNFRVGFEGSVTINRKDWAVHWNAAPGVVSKKVALEFDVAAIRQP